MSLRLCAFAELDDPGARGFSLKRSGRSLELVLVRRGGEVFAYANSCPHTGINLEWQPDEFLSLDRGFIQCATHGALFRLEDGYCVRGPCAGESLQPIAVERRGEWVVLAGEP